MNFGLGAVILTFGVAALVALPIWRKSYNQLIDTWARDAALTIQSDEDLEASEREASEPRRIKDSEARMLQLRPSFAGLVDAVGIVSGMIFLGVGIGVLPAALDREILPVTGIGIFVIVGTLLAAGTLQETKQKFLPKFAWYVVGLNILGIAFALTIYESNIGERPAELLGAEDIIKEFRVDPELTAHANIYHVSGLLKVDESMLAGRVIWVANRIGKDDQDLGHLDVDAFNSYRCAFTGPGKGSPWGCDIILGDEVKDTGCSFRIYVFLADGETVATIIQRKQEVAALIAQQQDAKALAKSKKEDLPTEVPIPRALAWPIPSNNQFTSRLVDARRGPATGVQGCHSGGSSS